MTILNYKGYQGSIEYEDGQLVIQLLHIDDFITATCESAGEAETAFHELVDDYLATCRETGRAPNKPYKGSLNIRMPPELHRHVAMAAVSAQISLNAWIVRACEANLSVPSQNAEAKYSADEASKLDHPERSEAPRESDRPASPPDNVVDMKGVRLRELRDPHKLAEQRSLRA
jgi:predicted HicB family RNase H-like nuclease